MFYFSRIYRKKASTKKTKLEERKRKVISPKKSQYYVRRKKKCRWLNSIIRFYILGRCKVYLFIDFFFCCVHHLYRTRGDGIDRKTFDVATGSGLLSLPPSWPLQVLSKMTESMCTVVCSYIGAGLSPNYMCTLPQRFSRLQFLYGRFRMQIDTPIRSPCHSTIPRHINSPRIPCNRLHVGSQ